MKVNIDINKLKIEALVKTISNASDIIALQQKHIDELAKSAIMPEFAEKLTHGSDEEELEASGKILEMGFKDFYEVVTDDGIPIQSQKNIEQIYNAVKKAGYKIIRYEE